MILDRGFGLAHPETQTPNTLKTRFIIGSLTKQFTAAAILLLQDRGQLKTSDLACRYLANCPPAWLNITLTELLNHTSGIPNFLELPEIETYHLATHTPDETIALVKDKPLEFSPGTRQHYGSTGYLILGRIIEQLSGKPYGMFLRDSLFAPLGMADTGYVPSALDIPHLASLFEKRPGSERVYAAAPWSLTIHFSAGGLYSTVGDLHRWERALFGGKVLSPSSFAQMTSDYGSGYGFGLGIGHIGAHVVYRHIGVVEGFAAMMAYAPDSETTVIVLSNVRSPEAESLANNLLLASHGLEVMLPFK